MIRRWKEGLLVVLTLGCLAVAVAPMALQTGI
jgi:hypothetical protein